MTRELVTALRAMIEMALKGQRPSLDKLADYHELIERVEQETK